MITDGSYAELEDFIRLRERRRTVAAKDIEAELHGHRIAVAVGVNDRAWIDQTRRSDALFERFNNVRAPDHGVGSSSMFLSVTSPGTRPL